MKDCTSDILEILGFTDRYDATLEDPFYCVKTSLLSL